MILNIKSILCMLAAMVLFACNSPSDFDADSFESITKVKLPEGYKVVTVMEHGDFKMASLNLKKETCGEFIADNGFQPMDKNDFPDMSKMGVLAKPYEDELNKKSYFILQSEDQTGGKGWVYLIDTVSGSLSCQIFPAK